MDGAGDDVIGWLADGLAAAVLGAAVGFCLLLLGGGPETAVTAASALGVSALALLRQVKPAARQFRLPHFETFDLALSEPAPEVLELIEVARVDEPDEALLLDDALDMLPDDSRVVQLFAPRALPTPGELRARIEAHLREERGPGGTDNVLDLQVDAAAALRQALGELRRNLA